MCQNAAKGFIMIKKHIPAVVFFRFLTAVMLCTLAFLAMAGTISAADTIAVTNKTSQPPITVITDYDEDYGWRLGCDLELFKVQTQFYLFLPSSADLSAVKIRYDGELQLYDDDTGMLYAPGSTLTRNMSEGTCYIYEYDWETDAYYSYSFIVMKAETCASVYIDLVNGDQSLLRINSSHNAVETGKILVTENDGSVIYNGDLTRMKGHGLTSYEGSGRLNTKNSYNINIGTKAELIEGAGKSKKWTMLRIRTYGDYDPTGMSYVTAFYTYNAIVKDQYFNICARYVDVYINGEYRGVYILTERMDINGSMEVTDLEENTLYENERIQTVTSSKKEDPAIAAGIVSYSYAETAYLADENVDITGGYILEVMCDTYGQCGFKTKHGMYINIKSPAYPTQEQVQYIAEYVQQFENALFSDTGYNSLGKHYSEYIDQKSFAAQTLVYAFYLNWEIYRTSTYIHKDVDGTEHSVLTFGPIWDFESGSSVLSDQTLFGTTFSYEVQQQYTWFEQAWKKGDYLYMVSQMNEDMKRIIGQLLGYEEGNEIFTYEQMANDIASSQEMNWIRWGQSDTYETRVTSMFYGLRTRYSRWFDTIWNEKKYLLGLTADAITNDDSSITLTATAYGKSEAVYTWYKVDDGYTTGTEIGTGESITVDEDGLYYCTVTGPNNAYYERAVGKVFRKETITIISNIIDTSSLPVQIIDAVIGSAQSDGESVKKSAKKDSVTTDITPAETITNINTSNYSYTDWVLMTVVIVALATTVAVVSGKGKKRSKG